jgi:hypothetical protein
LRHRWKTHDKKYEYVIKHILRKLKKHPKTFDELLAGMVHLGVREHYLSDILCDMLLHDKTIVSEEDETETRFYKPNPSQLVNRADRNHSRRRGATVQD